MDKRIAELVQFEIIEESDSRVSAQFTVNKNLPSFAGHFPENPVLPAVSIIDISLMLLSHNFGPISHQDIEVKRSKFTAMVRPGQEVEIEAHSQDKKDWQIVWKLKSDQSKLAQVHLVI